MPAAPWLLGCPGTRTTASGIRSESRIPATGQNSSSRHVSASSDTRSEEKIGTEQRTLKDLSPAPAGKEPRQRGERSRVSAANDTPAGRLVSQAADVAAQYRALVPEHQ